MVLWFLKLIYFFTYSGQSGGKYVDGINGAIVVVHSGGSGHGAGVGQSKVGKYVLVI